MMRNLSTGGIGIARGIDADVGMGTSCTGLGAGVAAAAGFATNAGATDATAPDVVVNAPSFQ